MGMFSNIEFMFTDDKSVGLYNKLVNDIYHSKDGALNEALNKFVIPVLNSGLNMINKDINILDICYGLGYNSKAFLNCFNDYNSVNITALDLDKQLILFSPFVYDNINDNHQKIFLFNSVINNIDYNLYNYIFNNLYNFCSPFAQDLMNFIRTAGYVYNPSDDKNSFLHNIYYNYVSKRFNNDIKPNKYEHCYIEYKIGDARDTIKNTNLLYDIVFLDGFSSKKDPILWTIDFLCEIKKRLKENSVIVTYSKSTAFRSALLELNFIVGKTIFNDEEIGTVASLNPEFIINPLTENDYKIISSNSGIVYRDPSLNSDSEKIIQCRNLELKNSKRISRTMLDKLLLN